MVKEGDWISIDGTTGEVYLGKLKAMVPDIKDPWLIKLLGWADEFRRLGVRANADYPRDAQRAREYGAEGIGLCRTEHMFFETERLHHFQKMIMTDLPSERREALETLLPFQRDDFIGIFRVMNGLPVIIRLIDPPLHEFLPNINELMHELADLKIRLQHAPNLAEVDSLIEQIRLKESLLKRAKALDESNPMLGMRGVRLGIMIPELTRMQVRAMFEAACQVAGEGVDVHPEIMIPLTSHVHELKHQREALEAEARKVMEEQRMTVDYKFGTMIEIPRAALTADKIAGESEFFSFGTNDLTQTTFGISRDDAEASFLVPYISAGILPDNPFATIDLEGVGELMRIAVERARKVKPELELRHLRRARRGSRLDRALPQARAGLRVLFALPGPDCTPGGSARRHPGTPGDSQADRGAGPAGGGRRGSDRDGRDRGHGFGRDAADLRRGVPRDRSVPPSA